MPARDGAASFPGQGKKKKWPSTGKIIPALHTRLPAKNIVEPVEMSETSDIIPRRRYVA
jgi:hypothetical protein